MSQVFGNRSSLSIAPTKSLKVENKFDRVRNNQSALEKQDDKLAQSLNVHHFKTINHNDNTEVNSQVDASEPARQKNSSLLLHNRAAFASSMTSIVQQDNDYLTSSQSTYPKPFMQSQNTLKKYQKSLDKRLSVPKH